MPAGTPARRTYYAHVEGMRGVAALYVFLYHVWQTATAAQGGTLVMLRTATSFLQYGHYAVVVFIVISGYCLGLPVANHPERPFSVRGFAVRRTRRLMPAYVGALVLSVPVVYVTAALRGHTIPAWHMLVGFVAHLALVHNLSFTLAEYLNGPMWSIALEVQIYVVFALLLIPVWRRAGPLAQLALALALGLAPHFLLHGFLDFALPWLLGLFGMGVVAAALTARPLPRMPWRLICSVAAGLAAAAIVLNGEGTPDGALWGADLIVGAAVAVFFVASSGARVPLAAQLLAARPVVLLGAFSYSLYLIHGPVIELTGAALTRFQAGALASSVVYAALIVLVIAGAYGFYLVAERPFLSPALRAAIDVETSAVAPRRGETRIDVPDVEQTTAYSPA